MTFNKTYLIFCIAGIALFFAGRCSGPKPEIVDNKHTVDSLNRRIAQGYQLIQIYKQNAAKAFQKGIESQRQKVVIRTIYRKDTAKNHSYKPAKKDSLIKEMFKVPYSDSSRFTNPVANGILDMHAEVHAFRQEAILDSISLEAKDEGIQELGYALNEMTASGEAKNSLVIEERNTNKKLRKEIRKQKFYKWLAFGGLAVVTTLAVSYK